MEQQEKNRKIIWLLAIVIFLLIVLFMVFQFFRITEVEVQGNEHYTEQEMKELIMTERYDFNTLYFYWRVKNNKIEEIPFIDTIEVNVISRNKVSIKVYEKDIIGYIKHLGYYLYFDKEGIVVESSKEKMEGVPGIKGIAFDNVELYKKLPVEKEEVFKKILNLTKLLAKYEIVPDSINFSKDLSVTLCFAEAKVAIGKEVENDDKIMKLKQLLPDLEKMEGTLHLENYDEDMKNITFKKDN